MLYSCVPESATPTTAINHSSVFRENCGRGMELPSPDNVDEQPGDCAYQGTGGNADPETFWMRTWFADGVCNSGAEDAPIDGKEACPCQHPRNDGSSSAVHGSPASSARKLN